MGGRSSKHEGIEDETQNGENNSKGDVEGLLFRGQGLGELTPPAGEILIDGVSVRLREEEERASARVRI